MLNWLTYIQQGFNRNLQYFDFLAPLALRLYLFPVFWFAGTNKLQNFNSVIEWFGNSDWGLGLPFPALMAVLAVSAEIIGSVLLLIGLATRWTTIPLMITMLVAAITVHWDNGWQAIHDLMSPWSNASASQAITQLNELQQQLATSMTYQALQEHGSLVVLNNGIEWAATYFVMLLALLFLGSGRYVSVDYWLGRRFIDKKP
ncbi:HvfX family Cu-binding RiPP maturation protein [Thiomicrorhabdus heinhorstiae]|nr:DoxX family protein [Thiomicrorhabdus heinhorstiae]